MEIKLIGSTNNLTDTQEMIKFSQNCGRQCYTGKSFDKLQNEPFNPALIGRMIKSGHHSVFEHVWLTFEMNDIPKMLAMVLNNEKQYATSEKSARYTQMRNMIPEQKEKYDRWMNLLIPEINKVYPEMDDSKKRKIAIKKLAQENARYMISVFTPTKMIHTLNLRQLNFIMGGFEEFYQRHSGGEDLKQRLGKSMKEFLEHMKFFKVEGLENQTDRHLSLFSDGKLNEDYFGKGIYSANSIMSFAGLAQAHRHRTINYSVIEGTQLGAPLGFFSPEILDISPTLKDEWNEDLREIAKDDFPQAQKLLVNEKGTIEDFRSKALLRMCGHAQYEIMRNTLKTAKKYKQFQEEYGKKSLEPKCLQGFKCVEPCVWGGKKALERIV